MTSNLFLTVQTIFTRDQTIFTKDGDAKKMNLTLAHTETDCLSKFSFRKI